MILMKEETMKTLLSAIAMSLFATSCAYANQDICKGQAEIAMSIMKARQSGVPITKSLEIAEQSSEHEVMQRLTTMLVHLAYQKPRYSVQENREAAAVDFGTEVYNSCHKAKRM
jgi:type III secretion system FlhB-like substrate exporter